MLNKFRKEQGFTLIELLIVVAIIGILAAVAIPQFSAYRMRGFNSAALSDIKNSKGTEISLNTDFDTYGRSAGPLLLNAAVGGTGAGAAINGPLAPSTATVNGALITGPNQQNLAVSMGVGVSNGVTLVADTALAINAALDPRSPSFSIYTKHLNGSRVFYTELESTAIMFVQNETNAFVGVTLAASGTPAAGIVSPPTTNLDVTNATAGNGLPNANWAAM